MNSATNASQVLDILVVDDVRDSADALADLLSAMGFDAQACYSSEEALAFVRKQPPVCVMLDVRMPDMDGLELAQALRAERGDDVVLIAVSGAGPADERASAAFAIVDHHFLKPLDASELAKVLRA